MAKSSREETTSGNAGRRPEPDPEEARLAERLSKLSVRLAAEEARAKPTVSKVETEATAVAKGFRYAGDLLGGVIVGVGIGWLLDRWLGISPWGLIIFTLLGFSAGVLNLMRSIGLVPKPGSR